MDAAVSRKPCGRWDRAPTKRATSDSNPRPREFPAAVGRGFVTLKVSGDNGKVALQSGWVSRDIASPLPPLVVNGVLFTASAGTRTIPAVFYAIDASNGKDLWNSMRTITTSVRGGLS